MDGDGCDAYSSCNNVEKYKNGYGVDASTACCRCGGGCTDHAGWKDIDGDGCDDYEGCDDVRQYANADGVDASSACCMCGGGHSQGIIIPASLFCNISIILMY